ncbi:MAG TPA: dTDP-4-dehydrorhamnose reductase [Gemmatimonadaceae bacterium]|nr:dTDP-4-dehydrorhamnose reductase [Gemmatimonadaceae bacterium]
MTVDTLRDRPILLLGSAGQIGSELATRLEALGVVIRATRADADFEQTAALRALVRRVEPGLVVNAAAYTAVDDAEHDRERCERINAEAPGVLAEEAARAGAPMVHFSTNYVFDGSAEVPYDEHAPTGPLSVYGWSKLRGEEAVAAAAPAHLIFRTAAVYGGTGRNFVRRILELAREREELRVVDDQLVAPTRASTIADVSVAAIGMWLGRTVEERGHGIYHLTSAGGTSWFGFAERILQLDPQRELHRVKRLRATTSAELGAPAARPRNGLLDTAKLARTFGITMPAWGDELERSLTDLRHS